MSISSPGIGSGLDVTSIVSKLMAVEAQPLTQMDAKIASYQSSISALGTLSSAVSTFQSSLSSLTTLSTLQSLKATTSASTVAVGLATSAAVAGSYAINVTQVAQAQSLVSAGAASTTATIGAGTSTTVSFQLGTVTGGSFGVAGTTLGAGTLTGGITGGALSINGTTIVTDSSVKSAKLLADAINAKSDTTGVTAKASATATSATLFSTYGDVDTSGGGTYALNVGGVQLASQAAGVAAGATGAVSASSLDTLLGGTNSTTTALAAANITFTGSAAAGTLQFFNADGSNIAITEDVSGAVTGGIGEATGSSNAGSTNTYASSISLVSASGSQITVGGTNPSAAGLTAGIQGAYAGSSFTQDANQGSGSIVIDSTNNTMAGIRDAINAGAFGVTASIVNDGSTNHLVLTSTATGATSTMKISLSGTSTGTDADSALSTLLAYDPTGTQNMSQTQAAQSTKLTVGGVPVTSDSTSVTGAIQGVTLTIGAIGTATMTVAPDSSSLTTAISGFVTAYNTLNTQINQLTSYDASTKVAGALLGDSATTSLQNQLRRLLTQSITGLPASAALTNLSQIGITYSDSNDGSLELDSSVLSSAITKNFSSIAGLFAAVGTASDSAVTYTSSTSDTKAGSYALNITTAASQGTQTGTTALAASTTIASGTTWTVTLNDTTPSTASNTATITIPPGSYTPAALSTMVQSAINGASVFSKAGSAVTASINDAGELSVVSNNYGSKSNILISDGTGTSAATLVGSETSVAGVDVAGTIGGYTATGSGQTLTGGAGGPIAGLVLQVTGSTTGDRGTVGFSQGYAYQLNNLATSVTATGGLIAAETTGLNTSITGVQQQETDFKARLLTIQATYNAQYTALDVTMASMSTTATFLTQQFAAIAAQA